MRDTPGCKCSVCLLQHAVESNQNVSDAVQRGTGRLCDSKRVMYSLMHAHRDGRVQTEEKVGAIQALTQADGVTPRHMLGWFMEAMDLEDCDIVKALLDNGMPLDRPFLYVTPLDDIYILPIHLAAHKMTDEATFRLFARPASINAQDSGGVTPLEYAREVDNEMTERVLLEMGAREPERSDNDSA